MNQLSQDPKIAERVVPDRGPGDRCYHLPVAEYTLYCFAQSGNAYKAALMLNLCGADLDFLVGKSGAAVPKDNH